MSPARGLALLLLLFALARTEAASFRAWESDLVRFLRSERSCHTSKVVTGAGTVVRGDDLARVREALGRRCAVEDCRGANITGAERVGVRDYVRVLRRLSFDCYDKRAEDFKASPNADEHVYMLPGQCATFPDDKGLSVRGLQHGRTLKVRVFDGDTGAAVGSGESGIGLKRKRLSTGREAAGKEFSDVQTGTR